jgi:putative hydrolase of the HAD superfamily
MPEKGTVMKGQIVPGQVQAVYFDAVGTLLHPQPPAAEVYASVGSRFGSSYSLPEIDRRFRAAFRKQERADRVAGWRTSEEHERQRWRQIVFEVLDDLADPEACFRELYAHFSRPDAWRWGPDAREVLHAWAARGLTPGIASNYDCRLRSVLRGAAPESLCTRLAISSEIGWRKPAGPFFSFLCRQAGAAAGQILFVGDDLENDYDGASAAGLRAVLYDPAERVSQPSVLRVTRLSDLLSL